MLSVETSADVHVNADVTPHLDIFNTATSSSQSSGKSDSEENSQLYVANSTQTDIYNPLIESILKSDTLCFYYTCLPTVEVLKYLFEWIEHIPGRKVVGREINILGIHSLFSENPTGLWIITHIFHISIAHVCRDFTP